MHVFELRAKATPQWKAVKFSKASICGPFLKEIGVKRQKRKAALEN